jgi:hypothetical protein
MPDRTLRYNVPARDKTEQEVFSYVVLLHRSADSRNAITGVLERYRLDGTCYLRGNQIAPICNVPEDLRRRTGRGTGRRGTASPDAPRAQALR